MNDKMLERMTHSKGFIAALDQSGGSTPKALAAYGIDKSHYNSEEAMFDLVHQMRTRVITSKAFDPQYILGTILFEMTMNREILGKKTADYLWNVKGIVPFLKIDKGLAEEENNVRLLKPIPGVDELLDLAVKNGIFGTKERSIILGANRRGIQEVVKQQFDLAKTVIKHGLVPIIEPEVDINIYDKAEAEIILKQELINHLNELNDSDKVIFKLTIPSIDNFYSELMEDKHVVRVVALSGGYSQKEANKMLERNHGLIASFSRALMEDLSYQMTNEEFDAKLSESIKSIYEASVK